MSLKLLAICTILIQGAFSARSGGYGESGQYGSNSRPYNPNSYGSRPYNPNSYSNGFRPYNPNSYGYVYATATFPPPCPQNVRYITNYNPADEAGVLYRAYTKPPRCNCAVLTIEPPVNSVSISTECCQENCGENCTTSNPGQIYLPGGQVLNQANNNEYQPYVFLATNEFRDFEIFYSCTVNCIGQAAEDIRINVRNKSYNTPEFKNYAFGVLRKNGISTEGVNPNPCN